jgi:hypothetical protein
MVFVGVRSQCADDVLMRQDSRSISCVSACACARTHVPEPTQSKTQTPQQAKAALPPIRFFFMQGSGPNGGSGGKTGTVAHQWFKSNATNSGGASAVCMLTAAYLYKHLEGQVPVGAIESCVGGTNVEPWTPPSGSLYVSYIVPLLPFTFAAALWDQGEADAKRTNSTWCVARSLVPAPLPPCL